MIKYLYYDKVKEVEYLLLVTLKKEGKGGKKSNINFTWLGKESTFGKNMYPWFKFQLIYFTLVKIIYENLLLTLPYILFCPYLAIFAFIGIFNNPQRNKEKSHP